MQKELYYPYGKHWHCTWWVTKECNLTSALSLTSFHTSSPYDSLMKSWRLSHSSPYIMSLWIEAQAEHCQDSSLTDWLPTILPKAPASEKFTAMTFALLQSESQCVQLSARNYKKPCTEYCCICFLLLSTLPVELWISFRLAGQISFIWKPTGLTVLKVP